jgi:BON domain
MLRFTWSIGASMILAATATAQTTSTDTSTSAANSTVAGSSTPAATEIIPPSITGNSLGATTGTSSSVNSSNAFGQFYANPLYQGRVGASPNSAPGGFGAPLFQGVGVATGGSTSGTGTNTTNSSNAFARTTGTGTTGTTGNTGRTNTAFGNTGLGNTGRTGFGQQGLGLGGLGGQNQAVVVAPPRPIAYTSTLSFKTTPISMPQLQADLRATLDRSTQLSNPRGLEVKMDGKIVVLSGTAASDDERRLAEGLLLITPGVRTVRNEIKVVEAPKP